MLRAKCPLTFLSLPNELSLFFEVTLVTGRTCAVKYRVMEGDCDHRKGDLPMSRIHQVHAENIVPISGYRRVHAERIVLLPLLAAVIAGIICLAGALNRIPSEELPPAAGNHAAPSVS